MQCDDYSNKDSSRGIDYTYSLAEDMFATLIWVTKSCYATNVPVKLGQDQLDARNKLEAQFLLNMID